MRSTEWSKSDSSDHLFIANNLIKFTQFFDPFFVI